MALFQPQASLSLSSAAAHHDPAETPLPSAQASSAPARSSAVPARGRKRTRKSGPSKTPQPKKRNIASLPPSPTPVALSSSRTSENALVFTLQSLANSMNNIDPRLRALETTSATVSSSVTLSGVQASMLQPAFTPSLPSTSTPPGASHHTLATAVPALPLADPRLCRDLSIRHFVTAFGIYRDIICSVFPERRQELDSYLSLICDLNLKYGRNVFYQYHKAFASKAALYIEQFNTRLDWSVLDKELLVMIAGGSQIISCNSCGTPGHISPFFPTVPFQPSARIPSLLRLRFQPQSDKPGRQLLQRSSPSVSLPPTRQIIPDSSSSQVLIPNAHHDLWTPMLYALTPPVFRTSCKCSLMVCGPHAPH
ncbi:hypothetical protein ABVT39_011947 [Epinephelus coioides]